MKKTLQVLSLSIFLGHLCCAQITKITGPSGSGSFGTNITVLTNGNYVVTDPNWSNGGIAEVGAVYLYNGVTHSLISTLTGSTANDHLGGGGISILSNGNYVIMSPDWDHASISDAGAVTWGNGTTGMTGVVSTSNSLVGSTASDQVGYFGVTALSNGNYVVNSPLWDNASVSNAGAVTWGNGTSGVTGVVSASNSLVGSMSDDFVGSGGITPLSNGNYVINSSYWDNASISDAGAVTWGNGTTGVKGGINASNSLVGSTASDYVGTGGVTVLSNGNYVVNSPEWSNASGSSVGAVTWGSGITGVTGVVSSSNSLVGSTASDQVGTGGVFALSNGNYVVASYAWDNASVSDAGAVTWGNGTSGVTGVVSSSNSLVGSTASDQVGTGGVFALSNGNYVVRSQNWGNASASNAGAVTWGNGTTGVTGVVSASNSLVGSTASDLVGYYGVTTLSNGNYVVNSSNWDNASVSDAGAVTWGNGTTGVSGIVSPSNSLVGSSASDRIGEYGITALVNGNYVVKSPYWDNASVSNAGAVTWGNGTTGVTGVVSSSNSLVGSTASDQVGSGGVAALSNGNYVVNSTNWDNASVSEAGAVTWGNGTTGVTGVVSSSNSLVGSTAFDQVGLGNVTALSNGNYVVGSPFWDNASVRDAGAVTWGNGTTGLTGVVSASNSLVGSTANDNVGSSGVTALSNANYVVRTPSWDNASVSNAGAVTWGNGTTGLTGVVSASNSLVGSTANDYVGSSGVTALSNGSYVVRSFSWDNVSVIDAGAITYGSGIVGVSGVVNTCNSILGTQAELGSRQNPIFNAVYDYLLVGYFPGNFYVIHNGSQLADDNTAVTETIGSDPVTFLSDCSPIGRITPMGDANEVGGQVAMKVYVAATAPVATHPYVRRYYDISPEADANTATGRITLFYSQADFDDFNENREGSPALPSAPSDVAGIANLRITQNHGTSTTGTPGSYTGWTGNGPAVVLIDPENEDIMWNSVEKRWEVTFNVTGFSGFFVHTNTTPLPVKLISFNGKKQENSVSLQWSIADAENFSHFQVQRSQDAKSFETFGTVDYLESKQLYELTDREASSEVNDDYTVYYRLKMVDIDQTFAYSRIVSISFPEIKIEVYPNPTADKIFLAIDMQAQISSVKIMNIAGTLVYENNTIPQNGIDISHLAPGLYTVQLRTADGATRRGKVVVTK